MYSMADAAIGAFSVFFTQSPSFLDFQRTLEVTRECSNAQNLFGMTQTPSDNHIRHLLDPVPPSTVFPIFSYAVDALLSLLALLASSFFLVNPPAARRCR
jgi:hypothetical protein